MKYCSRRRCYCNCNRSRCYCNCWHIVSRTWHSSGCHTVYVIGRGQCLFAPTCIRLRQNTSVSCSFLDSFLTLPSCLPFILLVLCFRCSSYPLRCISLLSILRLCPCLGFIASSPVWWALYLFLAHPFSHAPLRYFSLACGSYLPFVSHLHFIPWCSW